MAEGPSLKSRGGGGDRQKEGRTNKLSYLFRYDSTFVDLIGILERTQLMVFTVTNFHVPHCLMMDMGPIFWVFTHHRALINGVQTHHGHVEVNPSGRP